MKDGQPQGLCISAPLPLSLTTSASSPPCLDQQCTRPSHALHLDSPERLTSGRWQNALKDIVARQHPNIQSFQMQTSGGKDCHTFFAHADDITVLS